MFTSVPSTDDLKKSRANDYNKYQVTRRLEWPHGAIWNLGGHVTARPTSALNDATMAENKAAQ